MTLEELTPWLFSRTSGGIRWGLETTTELLAGVGDPHRLFHSLHIGGTNGKGSVAALTDAALRARSPRSTVGLYTSPHLVSFAERIRIDGKPASEAAIASAAARLRPAIERTGATFFEATTAIAFLCFADAGVEIAVVEVGLGGRLDATNVVQPLVTAITNIARDHTEYLGESIEEIAREKGGIFKRGVAAVTAEEDPVAVEMLRGSARAAGARLELLDEISRAENVITGLEGTSMNLASSSWGDRKLFVPLPGAHQARNAMLAAEVLARLPEERRPTWDELERGFRGVRWPGRLQAKKVGSTTWVFDVAHNPAGVSALVSALDQLELPRPVLLLTGILSDKDWKEMLTPLVGAVDATILTIPTTAPAGRRWDPMAAAAWLAEGGHDARVIPDLGAAVGRAATLAPHGTILVTGSVHTVGDALSVLGLPAL